MPESAVRVALLARPGEAREQLRRALTDLGASLVAEGDPAELDPATVAAEKPSVVLVSLEPAIEDALARFDDLLATAGVEVMYDDAEVTRQLDGWDLARWARHLAAKLVGTDLLPPPPSGAEHEPHLDLTPEPGAPPTPAQEMANEKLEDYAAESLDLSEWVPTTPSLAAVEVAEAPAPEAPAEEDAPLDLDLGDLELALGRSNAAVETTTNTPEAPEENLDFDPANLDIDLSALPEEGAPMAVAHEHDSLDFSGDEPLLADLELSGEAVSFSSFTDDEVAAPTGLDDDVAALAAQLDAFEAADQRGTPREPDFATDFGDVDDRPAPGARAAAPEPAPAAPVAPRAPSFGSLELMSMDDDAGHAPGPAPTPARPARPPSDFGSGMSLSLADEGEGVGAPLPVESARPAPARAAASFGSTLSLEDEVEAPAASVAGGQVRSGALLVLAGLGGPDAVRQLLSALPPNLPVPVLLYQHLDTGKHDRLVGQLGKASQLPLELAAEGKLAHPGQVSVLPPGVGVHNGGETFHFTAGGDLASVVAALPPSDSVVLVLSGGDPAVVPAVLALMAGGGLVLAQNPGSCFDAAAAEAVQRAGAEVADPSELARRVVERWN